MTCGNCGASAVEGQRFCGQCGLSLASGCPNCGAENPPENRFCGTCGTSLGESVPSVEPASTTERRVVSVLFVDLVGFTKLSEDRDSEDVRALITEYFDMAKEVVDHFGGTIDKFIGDAVMAWWGAETSNEDDAERAVRSALEIVDRVSALGERQGIPGLAARAGVMTGEAAVGPGGNEKGLLLGDMVNATSRLQTVADPGAVYVGQTTASLVRNAIDLTPAGSHTVKGREEPIVAHRANRVLSERGGVGKAEGLEPPFVGRDSELRLLKDALHATGREGRARLVSVVGQAGIGKSRLIWEFLKYVDGIAEDIYWHEGRSPSYGNGVSLWALGEMVRQRARISEAEDEESTLTRLDGMLEDLIDDGERRSWVRERLATLLGLGDAIGNERTELFAASRALFEAISRRGTTVLIFEDLQWADPGLLEFIEELPDWSQSHPILIVTATRPELLDRRPDWGSGRRGFSSVYLAPLTEGEMGDVVHGAVPGIPSEAVESITDAAAGVPLFAVETLRMLLGDRRLLMLDGTATVDGDWTTLEVPSSVQAVIAARLDRLPPEERELARDAAVLGRSFTLEALTALRDEDVDKVERRLAGLVRHEILEIVRDPWSPERGQYQWVQGLLREVAYGRIAKTDRHHLHLLAARYFRDREDPELAPVAASHYVAALESASGNPGDLLAELGSALDAALERALALHAHEEVISLSEMALGVVPAERAAGLHNAAALAAMRINEEQASERHVDQLLDIARQSGDLPMLHLAMATAGEVYNGNLRSERAVDLVGPHLQAHADLVSDPNLTRAAAELARAHLLQGNDDESVLELADRALGAAEQLSLLDVVAATMNTLGVAMSGQRPHQAVALIKGALDIAERNEITSEKLRALHNLGYAAPDFETALAASEQAYRESRQVGDRSSAAFVAGNLIEAYLLNLQLDDAERILEETLALTDNERTYMLADRSRLLRFRGREDEYLATKAELEVALPRATDVQARLAAEGVQATMHLMTGEPRVAYDINKRHFEETPFAPALALAVMADAAAISRDPELVAETLALMSTQPRNQLGDAAMARLTAVAAVFDGDFERGLEMLNQAMIDNSTAGLRFDEWMTAAYGAAVLADGPDRARFAEHGRRLADEAGAAGLSDWITRLENS